MNTIERLQGPKVFEAVRARGSVVDGRFLRFFYDVQRGTRSRLGVGLVVGKKHGTAVVRNRIKRRLRAACREELTSCVGMVEKKGMAVCVVVLFKGSKGLSPGRVSYADLRSDMAKLAREVQTSVGQTNGSCIDLSGT